MDSAEQHGVSPEVEFVPREGLYKEYGYTTPTTERASLELIRFQRNFETQIRQIVSEDPYVTENLHPTLPLPEISVFKKEDGAYMYEYRLSNSSTLLLSSKPHLMEIREGRNPVGVFRIEHLLIARPDGKVADALAQYPRHVPNFFTFSQIPKGAFVPNNNEYVLTSFDLGMNNKDPHNLVYTLLHENAHIALQDVDATRKGRESWLSKFWNPDADGRAYMAGRERDADAFALRVGKGLGLDTRRQMAFYQASLATYDKWTRGDNPVLYANSDTRKQARVNSDKTKKNN